MHVHLFLRAVSTALAVSLLAMTFLSSTTPNRPSPKAKTHPAATAAAPAVGPLTPRAQTASQQPAKPRHRWMRVSLLKTIIITGVAAAVTGIIVWRSYKMPPCTNCVCGACGLPPGP